VNPDQRGKNSIDLVKIAEPPRPGAVWTGIDIELEEVGKRCPAHSPTVLQAWEAQLF